MPIWHQAFVTSMQTSLILAAYLLKRARLCFLRPKGRRRSRVQVFFCKCGCHIVLCYTSLPGSNTELYSDIVHCCSSKQDLVTKTVIAARQVSKVSLEVIPTSDTDFMMVHGRLRHVIFDVGQVLLVQVLAGCLQSIAHCSLTITETHQNA